MSAVARSGTEDIADDVEMDRHAVVRFQDCVR